MPDEVFVLLVIPIACLSMGLTLHYAVKPFVEALIKVIREPRQIGGPVSDEEVAELRADVQFLTETVEALRVKVEFDRQLAATSRDASSADG